MKGNWKPENEQEFIDLAVELRANGKTWEQVAAAVGISRRTIYDYLEQHEHNRILIVKKGQDLAIDNLKQVAMEMALSKKHAVMTIFLLKALAGFRDNDSSSMPVEERRVLGKAMTKEEANLMLTKIRVGDVRKAG